MTPTTLTTLMTSIRKVCLAPTQSRGYITKVQSNPHIAETPYVPETPEPTDPSEPSVPASDMENADTRVEEFTQGANFGWVASVLTSERSEILERWLDATAQQPFHCGRRENAVADHIPALFDALTGLLRTTAPRWVDAYAPLEDIGIVAAAQSHSRMRAEQGLQPADVVVEFRLLRQEIWRALRASLPAGAPVDDVVAAEILVNDALDGAITQGLVALNDQVEQVREEFLATTMHDVRQPLTSILGEAQLLDRMLSKVESEPANRERSIASTRRIEASAKRMISLLETLTDMSKVALGSLDLHLAMTDLEDVVRKVLSQIAPDEAARVIVTVDGATTTDPASSPGTSATGGRSALSGLWDASRLGQVVSNLITNALKYSAAGTTVNIELEGQEQPEGSVTLRVKDDGIGIPPEDIKRVFSRYSRAKNAEESGIEGQGLGLYLCRGIVVAHGGHIQAESRGVGQGTTITVVLPKQGPVA